MSELRRHSSLFLRCKVIDYILRLILLQAYAHLSDRHKRAVFNAEREKRLCTRCAAPTQVQVDTETALKAFRQRLKNQNLTALEKNYFNTEIHSAEWRVEKEKLQMFRERARARVDSLAEVLRERRSNFQSKRVKGERESSNQASREYTHEYFQQLHCTRVSARPYHVTDEWGFTSAINDLIAHLKRRKMLQKGAPHVMQSMDDVLMGMLHEEIVANANTIMEDHLDVNDKSTSRVRVEPWPTSDPSNRAIKSKVVDMTHDGLGSMKFQGPGSEENSATKQGETLKEFDEEPWSTSDPSNTAIKSKVVDMTHDGLGSMKFQGPGSEEKSATKQGEMLKEFDEESSVINDFLAGLGCVSSKECKSSNTFMDLPGSFPQLSQSLKNSETSCLQDGISRETTKTSSCTVNQNYCQPENKTPERQTFSRKKTRESHQQSDSIVGISSSGNIAVATLLHRDEHSISGAAPPEFTEARTPPKSSGITMKQNKMPWHKSPRSMGMEQHILQNQKKKSEQLLRTLERLREETKSVAATLEKIKFNVCPDTNHVGSMFPGSCHMAAASMVAT